MISRSQRSNSRARAPKENDNRRRDFSRRSTSAHRHSTEPVRNDADASLGAYQSEPPPSGPRPKVRNQCSELSPQLHAINHAYRNTLAAVIWTLEEPERHYWSVEEVSRWQGEQWDRVAKDTQNLCIRAADALTILHQYPLTVSIYIVDRDHSEIVRLAGISDARRQLELNRTYSVPKIPAFCQRGMDDEGLVYFEGPASKGRTAKNSRRHNSTPRTMLPGTGILFRTHLSLPIVWQQMEDHVGFFVVDSPADSHFSQHVKHLAASFADQYYNYHRLMSYLTSPRWA